MNPIELIKQRNRKYKNLPDGYRLYGRKFIANILAPAVTPDGIQVINRDPRTWRFPPDAYNAVVEEIGPQCTLVSKGHKVWIERFFWIQHNVDEERIVADESQLLILDGFRPAPGVFCIQEKIKPEGDDKNKIIVPDTYIKPEEKVICGLIMTMNPKGIFTRYPEIPSGGDWVWIHKWKDKILRLPKNRYLFRYSDDIVLAYKTRLMDFEVINPVVQPSVSQPSVSQPSVSQPSVSQPSVSQPSVSQHKNSPLEVA